MVGIPGRYRVVAVVLCAMLVALLAPSAAAGAGVVSADAGGMYSLAVLSDGTLWGWGYNSQGQLGDGTLATHLAPSRVDTGESWADVSAGWRHALAIKNDGSLWAWGYNKDGQLGIGHADNTFTPDHYHNAPSLVATGTTWLQASAGRDHSVGLDASGSVWAWGANDAYQLGTGSTASTSTPVLVSPFPGFGLVWTRVWAADGLTLAMSSNGVLWQWGAGAQTPTAIAFAPGNPLDGLAASDQSWWTVAPATGNIAAITSDSGLWSWLTSLTPAPVSFGHEFADVGVAPGPLWNSGDSEVALLIGLDHSLGLATDRYDVHVALPEIEKCLLIGNDVDWHKLSAGKNHFLISKTDGSLWSWGKNTWGQLGNGSESDVLTYGTYGNAVRIILPTPIPDVANMTESDARDLIESRGFRVGTVSYVPTDTVEITRIISQTPASDTLVMPGWSVNIVVSAGPPVHVPNVVGMQEADARAALGAAGLGVGSVTQAYSSSVPSSAIISQDPAPNTPVAPAYKVSLVVSKGPQRVTVPYTAWMTESEARTRLEGAGFAPGSAIKEYSASIPVGLVTRTDPAAGILALQGDTVNLYVSLGKPKATLSNPVAPSRMSKSKYYTVFGYLKPRHTAGTYPVRIYKYRYVSGKWRGYGYVTARAYNYSTYTKYKCSMRLSRAGRWRLRAQAPADSGHALTRSSGYDYVTVR